MPQLNHATDSPLWALASITQRNSGMRRSDAEGMESLVPVSTRPPARAAVPQRVMSVSGHASWRLSWPGVAGQGTGPGRRFAVMRVPAARPDAVQRPGRNTHLSWAWWHSGQATGTSDRSRCPAASPMPHG
jgi:hypothetical protein